MTATLLILGFIAALNPFRAAAAAPEHDRPATGAAAAAVTLLLVLVAAVIAAPLLDLVGVTGASARIAAGIAMLAVALKDIALAPPRAEPGLPGRRAALVPLAFPVLFTPAVAMLAVAGGSDRGVVVVALCSLVGLGLAAAAIAAGPSLGRRALVAIGGTCAAAIAALTTLDGVYAI